MLIHWLPLFVGLRPYTSFFKHYIVTSDLYIDILYTKIHQIYVYIEYKDTLYTRIHWIQGYIGYKDTSVRRSIGKSFEKFVRKSVENSIGNSVGHSVGKSIQNPFRNPFRNLFVAGIKDSPPEPMASVALWQRSWSTIFMLWLLP